MLCKGGASQKDSVFCILNLCLYACRLGWWPDLNLDRVIWVLRGNVFCVFAMSWGCSLSR